jgi:DNA-binding transcriptional MerR regulator
MNGYHTSHITRILGVSPQTVRNWSQEFARHLSAAAAPGRGRNRHFTEDDFRALALVAAMKSRSATNDEIHVSLAAGQRGELPPLPPAPEMQALVMSDHARAIATLQQQRDSAVADLQHVRAENNQLHGTLQAITAQLNAAQDKIDRLNREIGRLEGRLSER